MSLDALPFEDLRAWIWNQLNSDQRAKVLISGGVIGPLALRVLRRDDAQRQFWRELAHRGKTWDEDVWSVHEQIWLNIQKSKAAGLICTIE